MNSIEEKLRQLRDELRAFAAAWQEQANDPYDIANAVQVTLEEVANAIHRVITTNKPK